MFQEEESSASSLYEGSDVEEEEDVDEEDGEGENDAVGNNHSKTLGKKRSTSFLYDVSEVEDEEYVDEEDGKGENDADLRRSGREWRWRQQPLQDGRHTRSTNCRRSVEYCAAMLYTQIADCT